MTWFSILKEQRQVARTIQSFKPIDVEKPFTIPDEEDSCYEKLLDYCSKHGQRMNNDGIWHVFENYGSSIEVRKEIISPDELYCYALEEFKKLMETPKEEIKDSYFSTKGLDIFIKVEDNSIYYEITYIYDFPIIVYTYVFGDDEL